MTEFGGPSFSLGLDLDLDSHAGSRGESLPGFVPDSSEDEDLSALGPSEVPPPVLRRLKRGPLPHSFSGRQQEAVLNPTVEDEIENFSSQEDRHRGAALILGSHSASGNLKISLPCQGALLAESTKSLAEQQGSAFDPTAAHADLNNYKGILPGLTVHPLRKIYLLDSDSDDFCTSEVKADDASEDGAFTKGNLQKSNEGMNVESLRLKFPAAHMMKDSYPKMLNLATPALDEFSEEYFRSVKENNVQKRGKVEFPVDASSSHASNCHRNDDYHWDQFHPIPPLYYYFNHTDPRIRELVRARLTNFSPIDAANYMQPFSKMTVIDYINQFGQGEAPSSGKSGPVTNSHMKIHANCSTNKKMHARETTLNDTLLDSQSWANPKSCAHVPRNAGKRRIHANSITLGHWFTDGGRRVYVTGTGEKLTGKAAYIYYRKESGMGFKNKRRKAAAKKKKKCQESCN